MYFNKRITSAVHRLARCCNRKRAYKEVVLSETQPLLLQANEKNGYAGNGNVFDTELTLKDCEDFGNYLRFLISVYIFTDLRLVCVSFTLDGCTGRNSTEIY